MKWLEKLRSIIKRLKREDIVSQPQCYSVTPYEIQTVRVERIMRKEELEMLGGDRVLDLFAHEFAKYLKDHMTVKIQHDPYSFSDPNRCHYVAELKIAVPKSST